VQFACPSELFHEFDLKRSAADRKAGNSKRDGSDRCCRGRAPTPVGQKDYSKEKWGQLDCASQGKHKPGRGVHPLAIENKGQKDDGNHDDLRLGVEERILQSDCGQADHKARHDPDRGWQPAPCHRTRQQDSRTQTGKLDRKSDLDELNSADSLGQRRDRRSDERGIDEGNKRRALKALILREGEPVGIFDERAEENRRRGIDALPFSRRIGACAEINCAKIRGPMIAQDKQGQDGGCAKQRNR
jgi:hypothetical protein